jgi:hypothetical protein
MIDVNKLAQAIERVGFVAHQFTLWVVPEEWFNSKQEPDFGEQAIMVYFLGYTLRFAPAIGKRTVYTVHFATTIVKRTVYTMHFATYSMYCAFCDYYRKTYSIYYAFCNGHRKIYNIYL